MVLTAVQFVDFVKKRNGYPQKTMLSGLHVSLPIERFLGLYTDVSSLRGYLMILRVHSNPDNEADGERG